MRTIGQPERITQTPVALSNAASLAAANAQAEQAATAPSAGGTMVKQGQGASPTTSFESALAAENSACRMVKKGDSATPGIDKPATVNSDLSFYDFLDIINPLQHIPVVSELYRQATGDTIKPECQLAGDTALGGVFGFIGSLGSMVYESAMGESITQSLASSFTGDAPEQQTAQADTDKDVYENAGAETAEETASAASAPQAVPFATAANAQPAEAQAVLSVFASDNASAHASYAKANMMNYLRDVNSSQKL